MCLIVRVRETTVVLKVTLFHHVMELCKCESSSTRHIMTLGGGRTQSAILYHFRISIVPGQRRRAATMYPKKLISALQVIMIALSERDMMREAACRTPPIQLNC